MTTVAVKIDPVKKVGVIAADSRASDDNGVLMFNTPKLHVIGESVYGIAGDDWVDLFIDWRRRGGRRLPESIITLHADDVDFGCIELARDGIWYWNRTFTRIFIQQECFAIGSGEMIAYYLMKVEGRSAAEAVHAASQVDKYTGGPIKTESVKLTQWRRMRI